VNARILARNAVGDRADIASFGGHRGVSLVFPKGTRRAPDDDVESGHGGRMEPNQMPTLEERVADLEAKMTPDLRDEMVRGFGRMADLFGQMERRFEQRFEQIDKRFEQIDKRFEQVEKRFEQVDKRLDRLDDRLERLDDKVDRHFMWIVGIQFAMMIVFIGALVAAYLRSV
jgi:ABC-type phosphate transport system auxiliary subunit